MKEEFRKLFFDFCREKGIKPVELKDEIRSLDMFLHRDQTKDRMFGDDYDRDDKDYKDLANLQKKFVEDCIEFIKSHPSLKEVIEEKRTSLIKDWNEGYSGENVLKPILGMSFYVDDLESSLEKSEWSSFSDSCIKVFLGDTSIIEIM